MSSADYFLRNPMCNYDPESPLLSVAERTPHDYGITAGMSVMLGMIENMASETDDESTE